MSRNNRPARSRRSKTTLPQDSEITQTKALIWLLRHPSDSHLEPRFFTSLELRALAEATVELGVEAQQEAIVDAAKARAPLNTDVDSSFVNVLDFHDITDIEAFKAVRELRMHWAINAYSGGIITGAELNTYTVFDDGFDVELLSRNCASIISRQVRWLWPNYIPFGKITLFSGKPKVGKSVLLCDIAARVSNGKPFPYCDYGAVGGRVIILMAEDDPEDTINPRLIAAGANLGMLELMEGVRVGGRDAGIDIARHLPALERKIREFGDVALVIIDPIMAFIGSRTDTNNDASVRDALMPLKKLAQELGFAVILNTHQKKSSEDFLSGAMGSTAFTALARANFAVAADPKDKSRVLFMASGVNLSRRSPPTLAYSIREAERINGIDAPIVAWEALPLSDYGEADYRRALRDEAARESGSELSNATDFLARVLAPGPMATRSLEVLAAEEGISTRTLDRARKAIDCVKKKLPDGWLVGLAGAFDPVPAPAPTPT
jgi:putative DNA primase/helicase